MTYIEVKIGIFIFSYVFNDLTFSFDSNVGILSKLFIIQTFWGRGNKLNIAEVALGRMKPIYL